MRRGLLVFLAPLMFSATLVAQTPVRTIQADQPIVSVTKADAVSVSPDEVVSRMLTFDRDRDGKVARSELAERMQPLMARADKNRDGALDVKEIRAMATAKPRLSEPEQGRVGGPFGGSSYGFADEDLSFSSRTHVEGAIADLKLAPAAEGQALSIAKTYLERIAADADADLVRELSGVLTPEQIMALQESLKVRQETLLRAKDGSARFVARAAVSIQPHINQFNLSPDKRLFAQKALDRFRDRLKMSDADRTELVERMSEFLNSEERDNLGAALARRPVVATGAGPTVFMAQARLPDAGFNPDKIRGTVGGVARPTTPAQVPVRGGIGERLPAPLVGGH